MFLSTNHTAVFTPRDVWQAVTWPLSLSSSHMQYTKNTVTFEHWYQKRPRGHVVDLPRTPLAAEGERSSYDIISQEEQ